MNADRSSVGETAAVSKARSVISLRTGVTELHEHTRQIMRATVRADVWKTFTSSNGKPMLAMPANVLVTRRQRRSHLRNETKRRIILARNEILVTDVADVAEGGVQV